MFYHGAQESVLVITLQSWCEKKKMTLGQVVRRRREMVPCGHKLRSRVGRVLGCVGLFGFGLTVFGIYLWVWILVKLFQKPKTLKPKP